MTSREDLLAAFELRLVADRYAMAVDRGDGNLFADQFTPDGELSAPRGHFKGRDQLMTVPIMMKGLYDRTHHGVTGMVPEFSGEEASAETYTYARHYYRAADDAEYCYEMTVRYDDLFTRTDAGWKLSRRKLVLIGDTTIRTGRLHASVQGGRRT
ncbi:MAG TPA: nuclear transport factor 2 family protein [Ensifer sp.]|nr:nuclear transport factor 2 family protein [Ensifer sp.]